MASRTDIPPAIMALAVKLSQRFSLGAQAAGALLLAVVVADFALDAENAADAVLAGLAVAMVGAGFWFAGITEALKVGSPTAQHVADAFAVEVSPPTFPRCGYPANHAPIDDGAGQRP